MTAAAAAILGLVSVPAISQLGGQGIFGIGIAKAEGQGGSGSGQGGSGSGQGGSGSGQGGSGQGGSGSGQGGSGQGGQGSLNDVIIEMEAESAAGAPISGGKGKKQAGKPASESEAAADAKKGGGKPAGAGGGKKGDIYGDLYVIVRDADGVPVPDADGYVQVYYIGTDGLTCCIPRDEEGNLLPTLADGTTAVSPIEVELGRLSVGRSPTKVLAAQYDEAVSSISGATTVTVDAAGRIVLTLEDGTTKTIDSPLENLALYSELISTGTLAGVDAADLAALGIDTESGLTQSEIDAAASFFAAASDKAITVTVDSIVYMNTILDLNDITLPEPDYVDYSTFTYDRAATYTPGVTDVTVLVLKDGVYVPTPVDLYEAVFGNVATDELTNIAAFTTATDDARAVINFLHEYEVPVDTL